MAEFFSNIWAWITSHASVIAGVLTPANLVLIIGNFISMFRQKKVIIANTGSSMELKNSLKENKELRAVADKLKSQVETLREQGAALKDDLSQCLTKLNCVLEVQQQAYSVSLAKTSTLDAINGIIANGKYAETCSRKAITDEVAELRAQMEKLACAAKESEAKVKRVAGVSDSEQRSGRYD